MMDDFGESLPSHSNFQTDYFEDSNKFRGSRNSRLDERPQSSQRHRNNASYQVRPESPPPPPPPADVARSMEARASDTLAPLNPPKRNPVEKPANGKFPFLKRGIRKEPSSLHSSPQTKEARSPNSNVESNEPKKTSPPHLQPPSRVINHGPAYNENNVTSKINNKSVPSPNYRNAHREFDDDGEEILLSGNSYNKSASPIKKDTKDTTVRGSTVSIHGDDWKRAVQAQSNVNQNEQDELDEFTNIELQLQTMKVGSSYSSSSSSNTNNNNSNSGFQSGRFNNTNKVSSYEDTIHEEYSEDEFDAEETEIDNMRQKTLNSNILKLTNANSREANGSYLSNYDRRSFDQDDGLAMLSTAAALRPPLNRTNNYGGGDVNDDDDNNNLNAKGYPTYEDEGSDNDDDVGGSYTLNARRTAMRHNEFDKYDDADIIPQRSEASRPLSATYAANDRFNTSSSWGAVTQPVAVDSSINSFNSKLSSQPENKAVFAGSTMRKLQNTAPTNKNNLSQTSKPTGDDIVRTRPVSTLHQTAPAPIKGKPGSNNNNSSNANSRTTNNISSDGEMNRELTEKARELEAQLEIYKSENAALKKLKKQHENTLNEVVAKREETLKWSLEEKQKVEQWCEQQRNAIAREKKAMAKQASDSRAASSTSIRKEKAEIEALQATIEKMKVDHEQAVKKTKANEARLTSLVKQHSDRLEELGQSLINLENEKLLLIEFISAQGLRVPKNLRARLEEKMLQPSSTATNSKQKGNITPSGKKYAPEGYAEEVDVQVVRSSSRTIPAGGDHRGHAQTFSHSNVGRSSSNDYYRSSHDSGVENTELANAVFQRGSQSHSSKSGHHNTLAPGEVFNNLSNNIHAGSSHSRTLGGSGGAYRTTQDSDEFLKNRTSSHGRGVGVAASNNSWGARSSKSSVASRYDEENLEAEEDSNHYQYQEDVRVSQSREKSPHVSSTYVAPTSPARQSSSSLKAESNDGQGGESSNRTEEILADGTRRIQYRNGTKKKISPDGSSVVLFVNGDSKHTGVDGMVQYYYAQANTTHTTFPDGTEVYEFPNKQVEKHYTNGVKEIRFPDNTRKIIQPDGLQESHFPDGVILREYPDGQKEVIQPEN